ncbi:MAG: CvpA family protein [Planctomycetota bacterium]
MATYDLLMLAILVGLTLYGYYKGMAWQIAYIASFVASYFVAVRYADRLAPQVTFVGPPANKFVAMALIYIGCSLAVWMLFRLVRNAIDRVKMEGFDRQMGAIIGFGRGVLWCVGVTFFAVTLPVLPSAQKQQIVGSKSGRYIARLLDETESVFPPEVHQVIGPYLDRLENELTPGAAPQQFATPQQPAAPWQGGSPATPAWPASSPAPPSTPAGGTWGASSQPSAPAWPATAQAPAATPSGQAAWPASNAAPAPSGNWPPAAAAPAVPTQPASWPAEWGR